MNKCLKCQIEYKPKRSTSKFCSDKCRSAYHRDTPINKVTKLQMQSLYNSIMEAIDKIGKEPMPSYFQGPKEATVVFKDPLPKVSVDAIMRKYVEDRQDCSCKEEYISWCERLDNDDRLSTKQKELVKNTH